MPESGILACLVIIIFYIRTCMSVDLARTFSICHLRVATNATRSCWSHMPAPKICWSTRSHDGRGAQFLLSLSCLPHSENCAVSFVEIKVSWLPLKREILLGHLPIQEKKKKTPASTRRFTLTEHRKCAVRLAYRVLRAGWDVMVIARPVQE